MPADRLVPLKCGYNVILPYFPQKFIRGALHGTLKIESLALFFDYYLLKSGRLYCLLKSSVPAVLDKH
jgi:hypothetical protein